MLFVSERSWKHHYVTLLLPLTYLCYRVATPLASSGTRKALLTALAVFAAMMATTSSEVGSFFAGGEGHEYALYYGMYFWSGVVLYLALAVRLWQERTNDLYHPGFVSSKVASPSGPHFGTVPQRADSVR